jgi:hypothetical protein
LVFSPEKEDTTNAFPVYPLKDTARPVSTGRIEFVDASVANMLFAALKVTADHTGGKSTNNDVTKARYRIIAWDR